ncbi:MAG TPA: tetratricopeptide repeat protein [Pyrinomonadaceae bacterium]|nr:tetratricopeptide repeat protein [Pyrinomonadaceae bacterium]
MRRFFQCLTIFSAQLILAGSVLAQRDRDTYGVGPQSLEVSGQVRIAVSGESAQDVPVRLERFSGGLVDQMSTDNHGKFRFSNLQRGYYKVIINAYGFRPAQQDADLQVLLRAFLVFELIRDNPATLSGDVIILNDVIDARAPPDARAAFSRGRMALAARNLDEAILHLQRAVSIYSGFFEAQLLLGTAYMDKREWKSAEDALRNALKIKPGDSTVLIALGEVCWRQKLYDDAEKFLLEGIKADEKSWHGNFTLGRLYWDQGQIAKAGPPIGKTLQLRPGFAEAHLLAGNILLHFNQQERALIEYQEYLKLAPKGEFANQARELVQKLSKAITEARKPPS